MLRLASATRLLTLHTLPPPSALRTLNVLSAFRQRSPSATHRTRRSVATLTSETSGIQPSTLAHAPALKDIEDSEYDTDLLPPEEATLEITQRAAEVRFPLSSIPDPPFAASQFTSVPLLDAELMDGLPVFVAPTCDLPTRGEPRRGSEDSYRVGGMPWVPVQNGALEAPPAR